MDFVKIVWGVERNAEFTRVGGVFKMILNKPI
jgi:hypothetical protein